MVRLRMDVSYDGTDFAGWATQPGRRTVAGVLTEALITLFRRPVPMVVAGRTDAGVHATGQVVHADVPVAAIPGLAPRLGTSGDRIDAGLLGVLRRLAGLLPTDVRVRAVTVAPAGFDARFSALRRHYRYRIGAADWGVDPLRRQDVWARRRPLDVELMRRAAVALIGLHDFAAFCRPRVGATTVRELQRLDVHRHRDQVVVEVSADAFCHSMVRALVGSLVAVGERRADVDAPAALLAGLTRTSAVRVAPACGLTLVAVDYPPDDQLADRNRITRAVRSAE